MTRNEAEASELKAARQVVMKANYKADVVQRQLGDLQKQVTGMQDRMNRMEALLQGIVKSQMRAPEQTLGRGAPKLRQAEEPSNRQDLAQLGELEVEMARRIEDMVQININSTHGVHLNGTPEGNFNSPSTGYSAVSNGWGQNQLPHTFLVSPTLNKLNPSHGSELTRQCPQYPRDYLNQPQFQYQVRQWNPNPSNDMVHSFYKTIAKGPKLDFPRFDGGEPLEWIRQSETYFATANVTDEAKFDLAQLYIVGRANRWLRRTGLLWKPPPWPDFCAMICDRFAQHSGYEVLVNFHSVKQYNISLDKAFEFNDYCRSHQPPISFIKAEVCGLFGSVFCDFGPEFTVLDVDGEDPHTGIIASISNDNPAMVSCVDDERLEFQDGDLVVFSEVQGMTELNDGKQRKIINARPYSFCIQEDTSNFGIYTKGGIVTQVKEPMILEFKSMRDSIRQPGNFLLSDFSKYERPPLLHFAFLALDKFRKEFGRFAGAGCDQDAQRFLEFAASINEDAIDYKMDELDEKLLRLFASGSRAVLNPMAAMFGGIVGQEVMKACSGKFHPHYQFFYFDSVESLPTYPLDPKDLKPLNSRYDAQISVFGSKLQKKMRDANVFVVGSGALGCEFLKNLALMGVSCGHKGTLTITDDDVIEKSNLSRQFLFRDWNIGQAKSTVAAAAASAINSSLHIDALQNRACPETEHVFPDAFWEDLDVVINALDNVNARMYMDMRCLYFQKPLLESGTLGAKCNTQMVIPHLTENYGASRDPPEKQAPMCTVHSFPHNIDHCLTWARSEFEGLLEKTPNEVNSFMSNPAQYAAAMRKAGDAQSRELLQRVCECLDKERCERFEDCITWARLKFEDYFANRVKQLTFTFPEDAATSTGALFWSAPKRFPHPLQFSAVDSSHIHFILAASILRAVSFGIPIPDWAKNTSDLVDTVSKVVVPEFEPKRGVKIETDEKATNLSSASVDDAAVIEDLLTKLEACAKKLPPGFQMKPIQFEKDDDTNFHMDLIAGLANMRARNYGIQEVDKLKAKFIAGRIIPAIATSTAMATGLVCLELYKVLAGGHPVEDYRNTFANLALPMLTMAEPLPPKVIKHQDMRWTAWDRWSIEGNITIAELLKWLSDKGLSAYSVSCGTSLLYNTMFTRHKDRLNKKIVDVAKEVAKLDVPAYRRHLDVVVACEDDDGNDIDIPLISIYFR